MKGIFSIVVFVVFVISLTGCYTIPRHFADDDEYQEIIIYYPVPVQPYDPCPDPPYISGPHPLPNPPVHNPIVRQPEPPRNDNGYKDQIRDPLRGQGNRGDIERKTRGRS